ncbi:fasciclin domain-containing protein [Rubripirellula reticaptiva]|uniref:fasciclin domain-containing protein n=1 Tax=Rubripirellula reticaptiva TaxID=2528013 RepID=UPI001FE5EC6B|nr:fasciclin domain-containing protein [Rubripirellula reticaptiva]
MTVSAVVSAEPARKDIVDTTVESGSFTTLAAALGAVDLVEVLKGDGPFTVFAPTDEAFSKLPAGTVETLLRPENKQKLVDILTYHVIPGAVPAKEAVRLSNATTLNGQRVDIQFADARLKIDAASIIDSDILCSNGVIHVIDQVILPSSDDIPTAAGNAGVFTTLLAAAGAAGLVETLAGQSPLTIFAPTDAAFAKLPQGTVSSLLEPENKAKLASILKYHVVAGRVYSDGAVAAGKARTLEGGSVQVAIVDGVARVNDAKLISTDIDAVNGVIHVIDSVMLPPVKESVSISPRRMIELAIGQGAPLYNGGNVSQCTAVYMETVGNLLSGHSQQMSSTTRNVLQTALSNAQHTTNADHQAWTLRHALDHAFNSMAYVR